MPNTSPSADIGRLKRWAGLHRRGFMSWAQALHTSWRARQVDKCTHNTCPFVTKAISTASYANTHHTGTTAYCSCIGSRRASLSTTTVTVVVLHQCCHLINVLFLIHIVCDKLKGPWGMTQCASFGSRPILIGAILTGPFPSFHCIWLTDRSSWALSTTASTHLDWHSPPLPLPTETVKSQVYTGKKFLNSHKKNIYIYIYQRNSNCLSFCKIVIIINEDSHSAMSLTEAVSQHHDSYSWTWHCHQPLIQMPFWNWHTDEKILQPNKM